MTRITDQFIADNKLVVGDTIRFTEQIHDDEAGGYVGMRIVVGTVVETHKSAGGFWNSVLMTVVESRGPRPLDVGAVIRRRPDDTRHDGCARLLWDDESQRAKLT
jgi:hypothetical protein